MKGFATVRHTTTGTYGIIAIAAAIILVIVFSRSLAVEAVYPMERMSLGFRRAVWPRIKGVFKGPSYAAESGRLRREVETLSMLTGEIERLERENASLRRSLGYAAREPEKWIAAPVLSDHGGAAGSANVIRVGRGSADGVTEGAVVASPDGLVGIVIDVTVHTCQIMLLTDPTLKVACSIELPGSRVASGILAGGDGDKLALTHIRGLATEQRMARVVSSGRGGVFPKGFVIGKLGEASASESGEWTGSVVPSVDFDGLEDVFIKRER